MDYDHQTAHVQLPPTESLCPQCLKRIPAYRVQEHGDVYLVKTCPEHGESRAVIWRGVPNYASWAWTKPINRPTATQTPADRGCPLDCGLCPEHAQQTCCVLLEVTSRCNLGCPVCFASSGEAPTPDPDLEEIGDWFRLLEKDVGRCNIQLSGGEPTVRDDLPRIIALGRDMGFSFFQLNTNGLRLATQPGYAKRLKDAGLSTVFLQFDGLDDDVYRCSRGVPLLARKEAAVAACADAGLGIVLVPTLIPSVNTDQIGRIIDYALQRLPHVRGVHFQPVSYFGRYPQAPADDARYTLPELMRDIETQTGGRIPAGSLYPSGCGHSLCSVSGDYQLMPDGSVRTLTDPAKHRSCCGVGGAGEGSHAATQTGAAQVLDPAARAGAARRQNPAERQRSFIARRWSPAGDLPAVMARTAAPMRPEPAEGSSGCCCSADRREEPVLSLDDFLDWVHGHSLTITAMAFQDVWTLDLERLRNCHLHVVAPGGRVVPFCAYNLTDAAGTPLHRPVTKPVAIAQRRSAAAVAGSTLATDER